LPTLDKPKGQNPDDVFVLKGACQASFLLKALKISDVSQKMRVQSLYSNETSLGLLLGFVYDAHAATPDFFGYQIMSID